MRLVSLCFVAFFALGIPSPWAEFVIYHDRGGQIGTYLAKYLKLRKTGEPVKIDGDCLSACTLALGILPPPQVCMTDRARLGFHAAWEPDENGTPVTSSIGTEALWMFYKQSKVHRWITKNGGLTSKMIYLKGKDAYRYVQPCQPIQITISASARSTELSIPLPRPRFVPLPRPRPAVAAR